LLTSKDIVIQSSSVCYTSIQAVNARPLWERATQIFLFDIGYKDSSKPGT